MTTRFEDDCKQAVTSLTAALIGLYDSVQADPLRPQEAARQFGINKTLTWNIAKLLQTDQPLEAALHVPGSSSLERMLKAIKKHGASTDRLDQVRLAVKQFDEAVELHVGDRSELELMLDSMGNRKSDGLELSRKLSFKGNSGVYGIQARVRLSSVFVAPNPDDPDVLDNVILYGLLGLRRLRREVRWPIFRTSAHGTEPQDWTMGWQPLDGSPKSPDSVGLLDSFSDVDGATITRRDSTSGTEFVLESGPVGNVGAIDCFRGQREIGFAPRYMQQPTDIGEFGAAITTPCQHLVFDLFVHRDLPFLDHIESLVFAKVFSQGGDLLDASHQSALPIVMEPSRLVGQPPAVATAQVPGYSELFEYVGKQAGWDLSAFLGVRLQLKFPPLGSTIVMRFPLESRTSDTVVQASPGEATQPSVA